MYIKCPTSHVQGFHKYSLQFGEVGIGEFRGKRRDAPSRSFSFFVQFSGQIDQLIGWRLLPFCAGAPAPMWTNPGSATGRWIALYVAS